jgi:hypothetical protein
MNKFIYKIIYVLGNILFYINYIFGISLKYLGLFFVKISDIIKDDLNKFKRNLK